MVREVEQVDCVNGLLHWHDKVDHTEIILEPVPYEDAATVDKEPEFLVGRLEGCEVLRGKVCIKVAWFDPREFSQVVHHLGVPRSILMVWILVRLTCSWVEM